MVLLRFSSKEFLFLGLELAGFSGYTIRRNEKKMNRERFKDSFYLVALCDEINACLRSPRVI
jgi:hypothetical protein